MMSLLIGTYTEKLPHVDGQAEGLLTAAYKDGVVGVSEIAAVVRNPSWLTTTSDGKHLYAVVETVEFEDQNGGGVAAYRRDADTGSLTLLNTAPSAGTEPAHLDLDPTGQFLLVANYRTGSVAVFAVTSDGSLGGMVDHVQHEGSSVHPVRQTGPHAHQILFDPVTGQVLVPDLGLDAVLFYKLDSGGQLTELRQKRIQVKPGAGPRHLAFHPDQQHLLLLNELDSTLVLLRRDGEAFVTMDTKSTLPADFTGHNQTSEVRVSASGRFVYASNRGLDSIAIFSLDAKSGTLELQAIEPSRGHEPRDFIQTPDGSFLLVANQDSNNIVTFAVDETAPSLTYLSTVAAPTPVCLRLI